MRAAHGDARMFFGYGPPGRREGRRERAADVLAGLNGRVVRIRWGQQVHGAACAVIDPEEDRSEVGCVGPCDALVTAAPATGLVVWTADCVPVLLAGEGVVAAVHAGWRGCAVDIVGRVVSRLVDTHGLAADRLWAALGPAISGDRYPVGGEVVDALARVQVPEDIWRDGPRVDLRAFLVARLQQLGVNRHNIDVVGPCTASSPRLASFRRDGESAGRQWSLVYREP